MSIVELEIGYHLTDAIIESCEPLSARFELAAQWIAARFELTKLSVSIAIVDDPTIQRLNQEHLDHDWPTDVISFSFQQGPDTSGEVIASWDTAKRLSQTAGWSAADELLLYVLHGMLHIVGMDDLTPEDQRQMRQTEYEFLLDQRISGADTYLERFDDVSY